jgi:hypothetical protein
VRKGANHSLQARPAGFEPKPTWFVTSWSDGWLPNPLRRIGNPLAQVRTLIGESGFNVCYRPEADIRARSTDRTINSPARRSPVLEGVLNGALQPYVNFGSSFAPLNGGNRSESSGLQELGGWESPEMVRRYAHLTAEHLARTRIA